MHGVVSQNSHRHRIPGGNRIGIGLCPIGDEVEEVVDDRTIRSAVSAGNRFQIVDDIRSGTRAAASPHMNLAIVMIADIFHSAFRTDKGVVALRIR